MRRKTENRKPIEELIFRKKNVEVMVTKCMRAFTQEKDCLFETILKVVFKAEDKNETV